jgi:hypothetical protein
MKRLMIAAVATAALAAPAAAGADAATLDKCSSSTHGATWNTPGAMFQAARDGYGVSPAQLAGVHGVTVGQFVAVACRAS